MDSFFNWKRRPLLLTALLVAGGLIMGYYFPFNPPIFYLYILPVTVVMMICLSSNKKIYLIFFCIILAGYCWISWQELKYDSKVSIALWNEQGEVDLRGEVVEDLSSLQGNHIFIRPYYIDNQKVKYGLIQIDRRYIPVHLENGQIVKMHLELATPARQLNPDNFSYFKYLKKKGIYSLGYVTGKIQILGKTKRIFKYSLVVFKRRMLELIDNTVDRPVNEVIKALLLGERDNLPEEWQEAFTKAGVNHLLAISGLHVGFVLFIFLGFFQLSGFPVGLRNLLVSLLIVFYIIITGFRPSVLRAGILSLGLLWGPFFERKGDVFNLLGLTALISFIINPYQLFTVGFQLTYLVLTMIICWHSLLVKYTNKALAVSIAAQFGALPLTTYYFNLISPIGVITNLWAIPLASLIVSLGLVGIIMGLINSVYCWLILKPVTFLMYMMKKGAQLMTSLPLSWFELPSPSPAALVFITGLLILLPFILQKRYLPFNIITRRKHLSVVTVTFIIFILIQMTLPLLDDKLEIIFFAVGQGDSILMKFPGRKYLLVDGGGTAGLNSNQGEMVILPFLKKNGIKKIDLIFATHFDTDHVLGLLPLLEERDVKMLIIPALYHKNELSAALIKTAGSRGIPVRKVDAGDYFKVGKALIKVMGPFSDQIFISNNENSIVLQIIYRKFSLLLTGDLEKNGEEKLIRVGFNLQSDFLKLSHHGSGGSSSYSFLREVSPEHAIISVGKNNYGHPSPLVLERAKQMEIKTWRTDRQGAIIIKTDGKKYKIKGFLKNK